MKKTTITEVKKPTANLTVNKGRLKIYNVDSTQTCYLENGQEFQLELFNPTTKRVLAKIEINGVMISQGGVVLRQGERVFLERYIDVAKKFLFETYSVNLENKEVKEAIQNNGSVKVYFYEEEEKPLSTLVDYTRKDFYYYNTNTPYCGGTFTGDPVIGNYNTTTLNSNATFDWMQPEFSRSLASSSFNDDATLDFSPTIEPAKKTLRSAKSLKKQETGRVEEGASSSQSFTKVNYKFNSWTTHTVEYKILPVSQKINTSEDLNIRVYCHNCGAKAGKGHNFCSKCGTKIG